MRGEEILNSSRLKRMDVVSKPQTIDLFLLLASTVVREKDTPIRCISPPSNPLPPCPFHGEITSQVHNRPWYAKRSEEQTHGITASFGEADRAPSKNRRIKRTCRPLFHPHFSFLSRFRAPPPSLYFSIHVATILPLTVPSLTAQSLLGLALIAFLLVSFLCPIGRPPHRRCRLLPPRVPL